jgi:putative spermidine/putrescine transport system substrate-binding protein
MVKRKVIPKNLLNALPPAGPYAKVKFASAGQLLRARAKLAAEWPSKVG